MSRSNEEPPRKKQKGGGMNKGRTFARVHDDGEKLCLATTRGLECPTHPENTNVERPCNLSHDLAQYLADNKAEDIIISRPDGPSRPVSCPVCLLAKYVLALLTFPDSCSPSLESVHSASSVDSYPRISPSTLKAKASRDRDSLCRRTSKSCRAKRQRVYKARKNGSDGFMI